MPAKTFRLFDLALDRVDLVRAGSNPKSDIVLFKSADQSKEDDVPQPKKKPVAKKPAAKVDSRSKSKQRAEDEEEEEDDDAVIKSEDEDEEEEDVEDEDADEEDEDEEAPAKKSKTKKSVKAAKSVADDDDEEDVDADADGDDDADVEEIDAKVMKSLPVSVQKMLERNQAQTRKALQASREARETAEFEKARRETFEAVEKAKSDIPSLPGTDEEKGEVMASLAKGLVSKKVASRIIKMLKAGNSAMHSLLMSEDGRERQIDEEDGSTEAELMTKAKAIVKSKPGTAMSDAKFQVLSADRDLWKRHNAEKRAAQRNRGN